MPKARTPKVPVVGRSHSSTKRSLVDVAEQMFSEHGYASTSLDAIVAGAKVTKGALYHHFTGKQAVFEDVFARVESRAAQRISQRLKSERDPWAKAQAGLREFLDVVQEPAYRRIVIQDGPAVLGYERFREHEARTTYAHVVESAIGFILTGMQAQLEAGVRLPADRG